MKAVLVKVGQTPKIIQMKNVPEEALQLLEAEVLRVKPFKEPRSGIAAITDAQAKERRKKPNWVNFPYNVTRDCLRGDFILLGQHPFENTLTELTDTQMDFIREWLKPGKGRVTYG